MRLSDSLHQMRQGERESASAYYLEAKREVMLLARQGKLLSPSDAWAAAGATGASETLWSISYRIGTAHDVSPEEVCRFLEGQFPKYAKTGVNHTTWDDIVRY